MRFLKHPQSTEDFPTIPWEQRSFTALYRDVPASEIPNTAVADARNALLYGERYRARPGTKQWGTAELPLKLVTGALSNTDLLNDYELTKSGSTVTRTGGGFDFLESNVGDYIVWPDGAHEMIVQVNTVDEVVVNSDTARSATAPNYAGIRGKVNAWHKFPKEKQVYIHIDNRVFYSDYSLTSWREVINKSGSLLYHDRTADSTVPVYPSDAKSTFDHYEESVYLFTSNGIFKINPEENTYTRTFIMYEYNVGDGLFGPTMPITDARAIKVGDTVEITGTTNYNGTHTVRDIYQSESQLYWVAINATYVPESLGSNARLLHTRTFPVEMFCVNTAIPPNTISPYNNNWSEEENDREKFGRRYLFSMTKMDGSGLYDRSVNRIQKETGTNAYGADRNYIDWESCYKNAEFTNADGKTFVLNGILTGSPNTILSDWKDVSKGSVGFAMAITADLPTVTVRQVVCDFSSISDWYDIAAELQKQIRATFPEFGDTICTYGWGGFRVHPSSPLYQVVYSSIVAGTEGVDLYNQAYFDFSSTNNFESYYGAALGGSSLEDFALKIPGDQRGWTHYSVYSTLTLGPEYPGQNDQRFVWQRDVPICKVFPITVGTHDDFIVTSEDSYQIESYDLLSELQGTTGFGVLSEIRNDVIDINNGASAINLGGGLVGIPYEQVAANHVFIVGQEVTISNTNNYNGTYTVVSINEGAYYIAITETYNAEVFGATAIITCQERYLMSPTNMSSGADQRATIGGTGTMKASCTNNVVTRTNGIGFDNRYDLGKTIFWEDGTYSYILEVIDGNNARVVDTEDRAAMGAAHGVNIIGFDVDGRNYFDDIDDETLEARVKSFSLQQRLFDALPSGDVGQAVPGFLATATEDEVKFYFSQLPDNYEYLAGHHNPEFQFNIVKDAIKALSEFPDQLIIYCANSTWRTQTNEVLFVEEPRIGESVAVMSGLGSVDGFIGIADRSGLHRIGNALELVMTSEPSMRLFDGRQYSEDLAVDQEGRGFIKTDIEKMRSVFAVGYEPNIFGILLWSTQTEDIYGLGNKAEMNICFRRALKARQGYNFAELYGDDWIFPESHIGTLQLYSTDGDAVTVALDAKSGKTYAFMTRQSPLSTIELLFYDKTNQPIPWSMKYKEHVGTEERFKIRHMETHNYFRLEKDSSAWQAGQQIDVKAYVNGSATETSEAVDVPENGLIVFSKTVVGRRVQLEVSGSRSEIQGISHKTLYDILTTGDDPDDKAINEAVIQKQLATPVFWISRGRYMNKNLVTGLDPDSGSYDTPTTGPDGKAGSAYVTTGTPVVYSNVLNLSGNMTIMFSFYYDGTDFYMIRNFGSNGYISMDTGVLRFRADGLTYLYSLSPSVGWHSIMIVVDGFDYSLYDNGVLFQTQTVGTAISNVIGDMGIGDDSSPTTIFDVRVYAEAFGAEVAEYYYRDVINQNGLSLLPAN